MVQWLAGGLVGRDSVGCCDCLSTGKGQLEDTEREICKLDSDDILKSCVLVTCRTGVNCSGCRILIPITYHTASSDNMRRRDHPRK